MREIAGFAPAVGIATIALLSACAFNGIAPTTVAATADRSFGSFVIPQARSAPIAYISATNAGAVYGFDHDGSVTITITGFLDPSGIFVDSSQNLWVADSGAAAVYVFAKNSLKPFKTLSDPGENPLDVSVCHDGTVYVSNVSTSGSRYYGPGSISVYARGYTSPTGTLTDSRVYFGRFITCDTHNNVFWTFQLSNKSGVVDEFVHGKQRGLKQLPISLEYPGGIKPDPAGNLLINDVAAHTITEYTESGNPTGASITDGSGYSTIYDIAVKRSGKLVLGADDAEQSGRSFEWPSGNPGRVYKVPGSYTLPYGAAYDPGQRGLGP